MPGLVRKVLVIAAPDGLVIQPLPSASHRTPPIQLRYGDATIRTVPSHLTGSMEKPECSFQAFGLIGIVTVFQLPFLISITRRKQVARIYGHPIYVVTGVAITPCSNHTEAEESVCRSSAELRRANASVVDESDNDDQSDDHVRIAEETNDHAGGGRDADESGDGEEQEEDERGGTIHSDIARNVIQRKGSYGPLQSGWYSQAGWALDQRRALGMSTGNVEAISDEAMRRRSMSDVGNGGLQDTRSKRLLTSLGLVPRLVRRMMTLFGVSQSFYFSYDWDLTRSLPYQHREERDLELHQLVDPLYFWNRHVMDPLIRAGHHGLVLPLMQGFVGQKGFTMERDNPEGGASVGQIGASGTSEKKFVMTLISRRSVKRAGLRYLRRGIDDNGDVANAVETEQLLSPESWGKDSGCKIWSFVQFRGSIPLFFTQSPYTFRPVPVLRKPESANREAFQKHMEKMKERYHKLQIVNLVEKARVEKEIGSKYRDMVTWFNREHSSDTPIPWEWFDFHQACRGMKFENVELLLDTLKAKLDEFGSSTQSKGKMIATQHGVVRTNCMDCLDRTNVVQSSFAKYMLDRQLEEEGCSVAKQKDSLMMWYNSLWADNGDAISKQYASTAAMKGDYTRTRKRDYRGTLTDMRLSITRFYNGAINDDFSQITIDYLLGNVEPWAFEEFEGTLMTKDLSVNVATMRQQALETCQTQILGEHENVVAAWILLAPRSNRPLVPTEPMDEVFLILTDTALCMCRFDWDMNKVLEFDRIELAQVVHIWEGSLITSTLTLKQMEEERNRGLVIEYVPSPRTIRRVNIRSLSSMPDAQTPSGSEGVDSSEAEQNDKEVFDGLTGLAGMIASRIGAQFRPEPNRTAKQVLKVPYSDATVLPTGDGPVSATTVPAPTERQVAESICAEIERAVMRAKGSEDSSSNNFTMKRDIINLEEAKRNTTVVQEVAYSIRKLIRGW